MPDVWISDHGHRAEAGPTVRAECRRRGRVGLGASAGARAGTRTRTAHRAHIGGVHN